MIEGSISQQSRYHTIVVMRTKEVALAKRFPHTIFTLDNKISYDPTEKEQQYQFNVQIDAVRYKWRQQKVILADYAFISDVFSQANHMLLKNQEYTYFSMLKHSESVEFFLYTSSQSFLKVIPLAIVRNTLIFKLGKQNIQEDKLFKDINFLDVEEASAVEQFYHFSSQFGLLSDKHFINNLVRGYREYSSYARKLQQNYRHVIHPKLHKTINVLVQLVTL